MNIYIEEKQRSERPTYIPNVILLYTWTRLDPYEDTRAHAREVFRQRS